jgi:hypothetical protein
MPHGSRGVEHLLQRRVGDGRHELERRGQRVADRRDGRGVGFRRTPTDDGEDEPGREVILLGYERRGWRVDAVHQRAHPFGQGGEVVTGEPEDVGAPVGVPEEQPEVDDRADLVEREFELGDDAEVAATAAERPVEVGLFLRGCGDDVAVRGDDLSGHEVVAAEAREPREPPDAATERQPGHAGVADDAAGHRQAVLLRRGIEVGPRRAAPAASPTCHRVDGDRAHGAQVDHQAVVAHAVAREAVPAAADRELEVALAPEADRARHLCRVARPGYEGGAAVVVAVPQRPRSVIAVVSRPQDLAPEGLAERVHVGRRGHGEPPFARSGDASAEALATGRRCGRRR